MSEHRVDSQALLSIGALSRATGIPIETLRTWERRYGFPVPERKPSGHRVYPVSSVERLRRIAAALARGHRASEAVSASDASLAALLEATPGSNGPELAPAEKEAVQPATLLQSVQHFDNERLTRSLVAEHARKGPLEFLRSCVAPLIRMVGEEWAAKRLNIYHEHFLSERVGDVLRSLRLSLEKQAKGPLVVCVSLPGEEHSLGLQMAALVLAAVGCRILYLGTEVPPEQIAELAKDLNAAAVAVSVSVANRTPAMHEQIGHL
ncbi:MAG: MerR family transcriptional regulator, partial [Candidatus Binatia bacterium]